MFTEQELQQRDAFLRDSEQAILDIQSGAARPDLIHFKLMSRLQSMHRRGMISPEDARAIASRANEAFLNSSH